MVPQALRVRRVIWVVQEIPALSVLLALSALLVLPATLAPLAQSVPPALKGL